RSLSTRLRGGGGGGEESGELFSVLQSGASSPGVGLSDAGREVLWKKRMRLRRAKRGDVIGRPAWESSFLGHPDANFFRRKPGWLENSVTRRIQRTESIFPTPVSPRVAEGKGFKRRPFPCDPISDLKAERYNTGTMYHIH